MRTKCLNYKIRNFVFSHFDAKKFADLNLNGEYRIYCQFVIDAHGQVVHLKTRVKRKEMVEEAKGLIMQLPKMKPGKMNEEPVDVRYILPIVFQVD